MNILIDTHVLLWFLNGDEKLPLRVKDAIEDFNNNKFVSTSSIWELAIKTSLGKFKFDKGFDDFLKLIDNNGFELLHITLDHVLILSNLEFIHRDPFDRLMVAQCKSDNLVFATKDENIKKYNIDTIW